jgi:hypothetical protein
LEALAGLRPIEVITETRKKRRRGGDKPECHLALFAKYLIDSDFVLEYSILVVENY